MDSPLSPQQAMSLAIEEGKRGLGFASPNPAVGCVFLDSNNYLIGKGYHKNYGGVHAEVSAYNSIKDKTKVDGASVFVTLEPCSHHGNTPPCSKFLAGLPIKKIFFGVKDPNPIAAHGEDILKKAGKEVVHLKEMQDECEQLAEIFLVNQINKMPFVHVKVASSIDGFIGLKTGESQWITSDVSRSQVQILRGQYDAVLIGRKTFETDNPRLNSRAEQFKNKINKVIIIDPRGKTEPAIVKSNLAKVRPLSEILLVTSNKIQVSKEIQMIPVNYNEHLDMESAFKELYRRGICSVLVEGGGHTISTLIEQGLVHRLTVFMAPIILGAQAGASWTSGLSVSKLEKAFRLSHLQMSQYGSDICLSARLKS